MLKIRRFLRWGLALGTAGLVTASFTSAANALDDAPAKPPAAAKETQKSGFEPFFLAGASVRIDDAPLFNITERVGGNFGLGFSYHFKPFSLGLSYEYAGLGREDSGIGPYGAINITRSLDSVFASLKFNFEGKRWGTPYFGIAAGGTWQDAKLKGVLLLNNGVAGATSFSCSSSDSANVVFRVGGGVRIPMSSNVSFISDASFDAYRLSSDVIQYCAPGAGSTSAFLFRIGLAYRFDASETPRPRPRPPT